MTELPSAGVCGVGAGGDRRGQADGGGRHRRRHPLQARPHPRERRAVTPAPQPPPRDAARRAGGCARSMNFSYLVVLEVLKGVGAWQITLNAGVTLLFRSFALAFFRSVLRASLFDFSRPELSDPCALGRSLSRGC